MALHNWHDVVSRYFVVRTSSLSLSSAHCSEDSLSMSFAAPGADTDIKESDPSSSLHLLYGIVCGVHPCFAPWPRRLFLQRGGTAGSPEEIGNKGDPCPVYFCSCERHMDLLEHDQRSCFAAVVVMSNLVSFWYSTVVTECTDTLPG